MPPDVDRHIFDTNVDTFVGLYTRIKQLQQQTTSSTGDEKASIDAEIRTARSQFMFCWRWLKGYRTEPEYREIIEQNQLPEMAKEIMTVSTYRRCKTIKPPANRKRVAQPSPAKTRKRTTRRG